MPEVKKKIQLEIAHVLFIDIVGYSKLSINDQHGAVDELTRAVRGSERFQNAETDGRLTKIRWNGAGFSPEPGRAGGMRGGDQSRNERAPGD